MLFNYLFSMGGVIGKTYLQFLTMHAAIFPTYFAPWDDLTFIYHQSPQKTGVVNRFVKTITTSSSTSPPIFSKIFFYNLYNNIGPVAKLPGYFKLKIADITTPLIKSEIQYYQSINIYDELFYFYPIHGFGWKIINNFLIFVPYRELYGLFHKFSFYLNKYLMKYNFTKERIWKISIVDFAYPHLHNRNLQRKIYFLKNGDNKDQFKFLDIYFSNESSKLYNYMAQFAVEMKNIIVNSASSQIVKKATDFIVNKIPGGKSGRRYMFNKVKKTKSLRLFYFSNKNSEMLLDYFNSVLHLENSFKILEATEKTIINEDKKEEINNLKKKIHIPHLFLIGKDSEYLSVKIIKVVNSLLKSYPVYFDCYSLKNSLRYLSSSPKAQTANLVTQIFKMVKKNIPLKKLFADTREKKYRLDILVFNDVLNLIKNRFDYVKMTISDLLATTMFLENIAHGYTFNYIFTIEEMKYNEIDFSIFKSFKYILYLDKNYEDKAQLIRIKSVMIAVYNNRLIKRNKLSIKELTRWSFDLIKKQKNLPVDHLFFFFQQVNMIVQQNNLELNYEILNFLAETMKIL